MRLYTVLLYFCRQLYMFRMITSSIIRSALNCNYICHWSNHITVFATVRGRGEVRTAVPTPPRQRTVANTVWPVPDAVITVWMCSWWWMRVSSETRRAVCRKYNKIVYIRILLDNYWHWFTMLGPMNTKGKALHYFVRNALILLRLVPSLLLGRYLVDFLHRMLTVWVIHLK